MRKFTVEDKERRIREILHPPKPVGIAGLEKLKELGRRQRGRQPIPRKRV